MTPEAMALEGRIREAGKRVEQHAHAGRPQQAREAFNEVRELVAQRTPETVHEMEIERGLAQ